MPGQQVSSEELEKKLANLLEALIKQGLVSPQLNKMQLVKTVAAKILDPKEHVDLSAHQLNNTDITAALKVSLMAELSPQQKNTPRFNYVALFKREALEDKDELKQQLMPILRLILTGKRNNKELTQDELERLDELAEKLAKCMVNKAEKDRDPTNTFNLLFYLLTQLTINLYGGDQEKFSLSDNIGEENLAHGEGNSLEAARSSVDYGREDPLGIVIKNIFNLLSEGVFNREFEDSVDELDKLTNTSSSPHPFDLHHGPKQV